VATSSDWNLLPALFERRNSDLDVTIGATAYKRGDQMTIEVRVPREGYLNVIAIGRGDTSATVLFPNQYALDNHVTPGILSLPGQYNFKLEQELPANVRRQENQVLVIFTDKPMNLFSDGEGQGAFRSLGMQTRSTVVKARDDAGFSAAHVTYLINR
jgi:hypothetical protein